ncbi:MAG: Na/Pi cotransporter family protein [Micavibrio sp.]
MFCFSGETAITPTLVLIKIIGGVCLLLWGLRMVRTGVTRAFGASLRKIISRSTGNRITAFFAGIGVTAVLQSATATSMIIASFVGRGLMTIGAGLAVMLGADVGTTLVAQVLSFDFTWVAPLMMLSGYIVFSLNQDKGRGEHVGTVLLGLGMMLFALSFIKESADPLKTSETLPLILAPLDKDIILAVVVAALLTWLSHSSLAIVLLLVSFVGSGVLPIHVGLAMVLGANLGGAIAPLVASLRDGAAASRVPVGNLMMRLCGVLAAMPFLHFGADMIAKFDPDPARMIVNYHTVFNICLALCFLPLIGFVQKLTIKALPDPEAKDDPGMPRYLDSKSMDTPTIALASAARETLRMADMAERMLEDTIKVFRSNNLALLNKIREQDNVVDQIYKSIKNYMARLSQTAFDPEEAHRYIQILTFSTNLEHAGDVIDKSLMLMAEKKAMAQNSFSPEGLKEIEHIHNLVLESVRLAQTVFVSGDVRLARKMTEGKDILRHAEQDAMTHHIERLREGIPETIATSSMHLDIIRDYRRINTYMCTVAYALLEYKGQLNESRLKPEARKEAVTPALVEEPKPAE